MTPVANKIFIYPVKSLDGVEVDEAELSSGGTLLHDREFAILDSDGNFINGKRTAQVHLLRSSVDFTTETISLRHQHRAEETVFHLHRERKAINRWLTDFFEYPATLHQNLDGQFLDIPELSGITILSRASLDETVKWHEVTFDEARRRFRANVEI
ncbi:MAG: MOSC N-terminal beta barrel domain-containing protein, partial [Rhizobacter sp.]|nr:MOSC N-terminal beta barrel domain-containing protein [Chlorobiales bacterium]